MMDINYDDKTGLVPAVIQDYYSREVLMLGYMNEEAVNQTLETKKVTFYSRSKERLWVKGETSGNFLNMVKIEVDCDKDTLLVEVRPEGPTCHKGNDTCFGESKLRRSSLKFLSDIIETRIKHPEESSYTNKLLNDIQLASRKVGEESVEVIIEALARNKANFIDEAADLLYHLTVLSAASDVEIYSVINRLIERHENSDK